MGNLEIEIEPKDDATHVRLIGDAGIMNAEYLQRQLMVLAAKLPDRVVFDLHELAFTSSLGMGELVSFATNAKRKEKRVVFKGIDGDVRDAFNRARLADVLQIEDA